LFKGFCDVAKVVVVQKTILANLSNFGYILDMKVEKKKKILLDSWLPAGTYQKKSGKFGPLFP
jgi:hypothetical protein